MWAICPCVYFAVFLPFLSNFPQICFSACRGGFLGIFKAGLTFDLWAGLRVFVVASCVGRGVSGFTVCEQKPGAGLCVCTSYRVQKLQGGRRSAGAGCFVIRAGFVCVGQLSRRSGDIRTSVRIKCSKVKSATF